MSDVPPITFADSHGARIAYQDFGDGPATVVAIPPMAQNIEMAWEWPDIRRMLERFGSFSRYIAFDKRGTGCSDRRTRVNTIDERVDDLRAVMDHAGVDRAHLFGTSEGGPMSILFAATYPDRVESLTLNGTFAMLPPDNLTEDELQGIRERQAEFARTWGTPESGVVDRFAPSLASNPEFRIWHQRYERNCASTESLRELLELSLNMDVRELLPTLDVPTLVIHATGDQAIPIERGRALAAGIAGARLHEYDGIDHFSYAGDLDAWIDEFERFVTGEVKPRAAVLPVDHTVEIRTLGRFSVIVDGEEVETSAWGSRRARQLCKRLVAARGWPVTRDELIDLLWPDDTDLRKLGARLSVELSRVRRVLGGGVVADRQSVRLDLDTVTTDLETLLTAQDDQETVDAYAGEFLPEDRYDDWTDGVRTEVRSHFSGAARRLADQQLTEGDPEAAADLSQRLIETDRYDEDAHRLLVTALLEADRTSDARRAHERWRSVMEELGVEVAAFDEV